MSETESFSFNFHIGESSVPKEKLVFKAKTVRERSRQRKKLKAENSVSQSEATEDSKTESEVETGESETTERKSVRSGAKPHGAITSSLFTKNPEVPKIKRTEVIQVVEEVFSKQTFSSVTDLHPHMVANLESRLGVVTMTTIQCKSIPVIMRNDGDVLIQSQTGSGKTLAYAVPVVNKLQTVRPKIQRSDGTFAIILVPTRELAVQSYECLQKLVYPFTWLVPGCFMGGEKRKAEKVRLRKGVNLVVATPGRLLDHLQRTENLNLSPLKWLIIDEADRLLDLGYEKSVQEIMEKIGEKSPQQHSTVLLSATLSMGVERLAGMSLSNPLRLSLNSDSDQPDVDVFALPERLDQQYIVVPLKLRLVSLVAFIMDQFMKSEKATKIIVFLSTLASVDFHHDIFHSVICSNDDVNDDVTELDYVMGMENVNCYKLHGEMIQVNRTKAYQDFVSAKSGILFCTDVAARGLHLPRVDWIIQYTAPPTCSEYIHRVGRTARAGRRGQSILFLLPSEVDYVKILNQQKISLEEVDMHKVLERLILTDSIHKQSKSKKVLHKQTITQNATTLQNTLERYVISDRTHTETAGKACLSYIRGYSTYPKSVKSIFHVKNLHLGHVAKSFALRQAPGGLGQQFGGIAGAGSKQKSRFRPEKRRMTSQSVSEFSSGLDLRKKQKKYKQSVSEDDNY